MIRSALDSPDVGASFETHYHVWEASENFFQTNNARRFNFFSPIGEKGPTFNIGKKSSSHDFPHMVTKIVAETIVGVVRS